MDNLHISTQLTIAGRSIYTFYWFLIVADDLIHITEMIRFKSFPTLEMTVVANAKAKYI